MRKNVLLSLGMMAVLAAGLLVSAPRAVADPITGPAQAVRMLDAAGNQVGDAVGASRFTRDATGISFELATSGLAPLNTYTIWWVLYKPDKTVLLASYATGAVALPNGMASFAASLPVGPLPKVDGRIVMASTAGAMFDNPMGITVELVLRTHGPIRVEQLAEQLTTFDGACPPNTCANVQSVLHAP